MALFRCPNHTYRSITTTVTTNTPPLVARLLSLPMPNTEPSSFSRLPEVSSKGIAPDGDALIRHHQQFHPSSVQSLVNEEIERYYHQRQMLTVAGTAVEAGVGERVQLGVWGKNERVSNVGRV